MSDQSTIRVRFAPSPTGYLHTGGARTALFNWLWARQSGGSFILRIEDTDEERCTEESTRAILDGLMWLGLDWDEGPDPDPARFGAESLGEHGPYFQSERVARHLELVEQLLDEGKAFYCPATAEEMTAADGKKKLLSPYRDLSPEEQHARLEDAGGQLPVRFKCPPGEEVAWHDACAGGCSFQSDEIGDFIFVKSNGKSALQLRRGLRRRRHAASPTCCAARTTSATRPSRSCSTKRWAFSRPCSATRR